MQIHSAGGPVFNRGAGGESEPRLIRAAHEFEGQMLKELLKPLTATDGLTGSESGDNSSGTLGEFASEALGKALSEQGGFGIANRILNQLSRPGNQSEMAPVTGKVHFDTAVRTLKSLE